MEIYLIRHTTPEIDKGLIYGRTNVGLTATCEGEAKNILKKLPPDFDAVFSSPSDRCTYLARQIATDYMTDERLLEVNFGLWEGKTWDTVNQHELKLWMEDFVHVCPPQGESMFQMNQRVLAFWNMFLQQPYQKTAIITHGGVIRLILAAITQTPLHAAFSIKVCYGDIFMITQEQNTLHYNIKA